MQPLIYVYTQYNNIYQWIQLFFNETNLIAVFAVYRNKHLYFCLEEYFEKKKNNFFGFLFVLHYTSSYSAVSQKPASENGKWRHMSCQQAMDYLEFRCCCTSFVQQKLREIDATTSKQSLNLFRRFSQIRCLPPFLIFISVLSYLFSYFNL